MLRDSLGWKGKICLLSGILRGLQRSKMTKFRKEVITACLAALGYWIWHARNRLIWEDESINPVLILVQIRKTVKIRIKERCKKVLSGDLAWFENL